MTFTNINNNQAQYVEQFQKFQADEQLALMWYIYEEVGPQITPAADSNSTGMDIARGWFDRVQEMSQDKQLQVQRDIVARKDSEISRQYGSLDSSTKLSFWYLLAQGIENGSIVPVPGDFSLSNDAQNFLNTLKGMNFNDQISLMKSVVLPMGFASPRQTQV